MCLAAVIGGSGLAVVHQYRFAAMESVASDMAGTAAARVLLGGLVAAWLGPEVAGLGSGTGERFPFLLSWAGLAGVQALALVVVAVGFRPSGGRGAGAGGG